jgi:cell wall-associated NlpC family hydrolase
LHLAFEMPGTGSGVAGAGSVPVGASAVGAAPAAANAAATYPAGASPAASAANAVSAGTVDPTASASPGASAGPGVAASTAPPGGAVEAAVSSGAAPPGATDSAYASPTAHSAFEAAKRELGVPYVYGGESTSGFDCSGLMQWAYHQVGVNLPRVAADQFNVGTSVGLTDLREGDLVFFRIGGGTVDHVGMYVGNHMFIEAPRTGENVQYADLRTPYWAQQFAGGRRIVPLAGPAAAAGSSVAAAPAAAVGSGVAGAPPAVNMAQPAIVSTAPVAGTAPAGLAPAAGGAPAAGVPTAAGVAPAAAGAPAAGTGVPGAAAPPTAGAPPASGAVPPTGAPAAGAAPGTAEFQAVAPQGHRHTVQFLQAVQPSAASPPAASPAQPAPIDVSSTGQPPAEQIPATAPPAVGQPAVSGLADQVAAGAPGAAPGSVISVSSSLLTSGQQTFAAHLASLTGLDPRVVAAWELAEESGSAAQGRQAASNFNWLNIGYFDSGAGNIAFDKEFGDPVTAAEQTARFLKGTWGGASSGIQAILQTVGKPPHEQMMAIANSGWASSHYGGGANLIGTFNELDQMKIETAAPAAAAGVAAAGVAPAAAGAGPAPAPAPGIALT